MTVEDFNYDLPEGLIAQTPLKKRDESRLMVLDKKTGDIEHKHFKDIISYLEAGDTLVLNDTKVLPARLYGEKEDTCAAIEVLLLKNTEGDTWECLVKPARRIKEGTVVSFGNGKLKATIQISLDEDEAIVKQKVHEAIDSKLDGKNIVKEIYVKNKIYNIVVK